MKNNYISIVFFIIAICSIWCVRLHSQEINKVYPPGTNGGLSALVFDDKGHGYAALTCGILMITDDMGSTWSETPLNLAAKSLYIMPGTNGLGIVLPTQNNLYYSEDGGMNWTDRTPIGLSIIDQVAVVNNQNIFVVGRDQFIHRSSDLGMNWVSSSSGLSTGGQITFFDNMHGWAGPRSGHLSATTDGGATWTPIHTLDDSNNYSNTTFLSPQIGYRSSSTKLFKTINGGMTWDLIFNGPNFYSNFKAFDEHTLYTYSGSVHAFSLDGGITWTANPHLSNANESFCFALSATQIWRYGLNKSILFTANMGTSFTRQNGEFIDAITDIEFKDALNGTAVTGGGTILQTQNGGRQWTRLSSTFDGKIHGVTYSSDGSLLIAGNGVGIQRSTDNGASFMLVSSGSYTAPKFKTSVEGTVYAHDSREILRSSDNGSSWTSIYSTPSPSTRNFAAPSDQALYVLGNNGFMTKSTDQGATWTEIDLNTTATPLEIYFASASEGMVISNDSIRWTIDGGQTFDAVSGRILPGVRQVLMDDASNGLAVLSSSGSSAARIFKTTDGWRTSQQIHSTCQGLQTLTRNLDTGAAWFAGEGYNIETSDQTITAVYDYTAPYVKKLYAYPNPTSAITTIKFPEIQLPARLYVFDLSGREVIRDVLRRSVDAFELDLSRFSSGLYTIYISDGATNYTQKIILNQK